MKKIIQILILLIFGTTSIFACTCPPIKGLNGKFAGIVTADSLMKNTLLVSVTSKSDSGIIVEIRKDYYDKVDFNFLFIQNGQPGVYCIHSTDNFQVGETYLISPYSIDLEKRVTWLPICWESFVNLSENPIKAYINNQKQENKLPWTIPQIENSLGIKIPID